jgi:hypothetical protein
MLLDQRNYRMYISNYQKIGANKQQLVIKDNFGVFEAAGTSRNRNAKTGHQQNQIK